MGDVYLVAKVLQRKGDSVRVRWLGFDTIHRYTRKVCYNTLGLLDVAISTRSYVVVMP